MLVAFTGVMFMTAARPETMAAALIPQESVKEPFFSNAGRASNGGVVSPD